MRPQAIRITPRALQSGSFTLVTLFGLLGFAAVQPVAAQQVKPEYFSEMKWRSIGPNRSGLVSAVVGIPGDPTTYYAGMPQGGVWKTTNAGNTWKPVIDAYGVVQAPAVAVAPSAPNTVFVGAGGQPGTSGVWKSTDAGATWANIGPAGAGSVGTVIVDPKNSNLVFAAVGGGGGGFGAAPAAPPAPGPSVSGIYRSIDGGRTWKQVLEGAASGLYYDYFDPMVMFAMVGAGGGRGGGLAAGGRGRGAAPVGPPPGETGLHRSIDGGVTWKPVAGRGLPPGTSGFSMAVASGTHGKRLYAQIRGGRGAGAGGGSGIYRSDDGGDTWTFGTKEIASAGGKMYADPKNPDVVYLMGTAVYRSIDGAKNFLAFMGAPSGDDPRNMWIDPTNAKRMILGVDQGPTISVDGGLSWTVWYNLVNGQFYRVYADNSYPYYVCGPQQDSGTACVLSRSDFGEIRPQDWYPAGGFENGFIVADPLNPRWIYTQGWWHVLRRFDRVTSQVATLYTPTPQDRFGGAPPLAFSPQDPHTLYMGAQYVLASSDNAQHWKQISPDLTIPTSGVSAAQDTAGRRTGPVAGGSIGALVPSPIAAGVIWVGTGNGQIQVTRDGGGTWKNVTPASLAGGGINVLDASHADAAVAYAAVTARDNLPHLYRTGDFGASWQEISNGLPSGALTRTIREDPVDPNLLYAGTTNAAWVSFDRGAHWQSLQLNLPHTIVSDMTVKGSDLVISTYGRGFWILDNVTPLRQIGAAMSATTSAFFFQPDTTVRHRWDNTQDTPVPVEVPTGQNPPEGVIFDYYLKAAATGGIHLTILDGEGRTVRDFSNLPPPQRDTLMLNVPGYWFKPPIILPTTAGMHRIAWDLRYEEPTILPYGYSGTLLPYTELILNWHAIAGQTPRFQPVGPLMVPGTYTAKLTVGGQSFNRQFTVIPDPRVGVAQADLVAQLKLMLRMSAGLTSSTDGFKHVQKLDSAVANAVNQSKGKAGAAEIAAAAQTLAGALNALMNATQNGFGPPNRDLARRLGDMVFGDVLPSPSVVTAIDLNCKDIDGAFSAFRQLQSTSVPPLNALLTKAQISALPVWSVPTAPACGGN